MTPYQTLGVAPQACADEIRRAYRRLAQQWHPDRNRSPTAKARFQALQAAYEILSDAAARAAYDRAYVAPPAPPPTAETTDWRWVAFVAITIDALTRAFALYPPAGALGVILASLATAFGAGLCAQLLLHAVGLSRLAGAWVLVAVPAAVYYPLLRL